MTDTTECPKAPPSEGSTLEHQLYREVGGYGRGGTYRLDISRRRSPVPLCHLPVAPGRNGSTGGSCSGSDPRGIPDDGFSSKGSTFDDFEEGFPALLTFILMPLTFRITVGIGAVFVMYTLIKVVKGKVGEVHPLMWVVAIAFLIYFGHDVLGAAISA